MCLYHVIVCVLLPVCERWIPVRFIYLSPVSPKSQKVVLEEISSPQITLDHHNRTVTCLLRRPRRRLSGERKAPYPKPSLCSTNKHLIPFVQSQNICALLLSYTFQFYYGIKMHWVRTTSHNQQLTHPAL